MFVVVFCVLFVISIVVDVKRLKAIRENTAIYRKLEEKVIKMREDIQLSVESQKDNSISIDELTNEILKRMTDRLDKFK